MGPIEVKSVPLRQQVLEVLRFRVVSGEFEVGEIYSAVALAAELGVSASPVRDAMLTLAGEGLMEAVRNRGFRVVPLTDMERRNIHQLRVLIEIPSMVALAGSREIRERQQQFTNIVEELVAYARADDLVGFLEADRRFHLGILALLNNTRLTSIIGNLRDQTRHYGLKGVAARGQMIALAEHHRMVLEAMLSGDRVSTERLMTEHLAHMITD